MDLKQADSSDAHLPSAAMGLKQAESGDAHLPSAAMELAATLGARRTGRHRSTKAFQTLRVRHFWCDGALG